MIARAAGATLHRRLWLAKLLRRSRRCQSKFSRQTKTSKSFSSHCKFYRCFFSGFTIVPLGRLNDVTAVRSQDTTTRLIIVTLIQSVHRQRCGNPLNGPIFANQARNPLDLNACYQRQMKYLLKSAGLSWHGWHGFRRALASNLNRLGIDDW